MLKVDNTGMYNQVTIQVKRRTRINRVYKFARDLPKWWGMFKGNNWAMRVWLVFLMFKIVMK